ncbi:MAG: PEP-CTERM sorting domain-containing protein [Phycisphaerae bacterium]|nr:PEP-CTERM sorting domain-containing protein [Phycisphaerae bacterium]
MKTAVLVSLLVVVGYAYAEDTNPPSWRGNDNTTYQYWEFASPTNPVMADNPGGNPYGNATATIAGNFPYTMWMAEDQGYQGVWKFEDYFLLEIPNCTVSNDYKEIWLQITFYAEDGADPNFMTLPAMSGAVEVIEKSELPLLPGATITYWQATYRITIEPNPDFESIYIMPDDCTTFIDELIIDTICIPEPTSLFLLAVAGLMLRRRR